MKRYLLLFAIVGIAAAWVNKPLKSSRFGLHKYSYRFRSYDGTRWYYAFDLTRLGWQVGWDYDCYPSQTVCSFMADPGNAHSDGTGMYFYSWNIPEVGVDNTGYFVSNH
jgi:hypothetical protein